MRRWRSGTNRNLHTRGALALIRLTNSDFLLPPLHATLDLPRKSGILQRAMASRCSIFGRKGLKVEERAPDKAERTVAAATLLFNQEPIFDVSNVDRSIQARFAGTPFYSGKQGDAHVWDGNPTSVLQVGGIPVMVSLIRFPVPLGVFVDNPHQEFAFPGWKEVAANHRCHMLISGLSIDHIPVDGGPAERLRLRARMAIEVAAALAVSHRPACAAWLPAQMLTSTPNFISDFREAGAPVSPRPLVGLDRINTASGIVTRTRGVALFAGREVEHPPTQDDQRTVLRRVMQLAKWLIDRGPVVGDGDVIGNDEPHFVRAYYARSEGVDLLRIGFEARH